MSSLPRPLAEEAEKSSEHDTGEGQPRNERPNQGHRSATHVGPSTCVARQSVLCMRSGEIDGLRPIES